MFDWFLSENDAIGMLKKDHDKVKELFDAFKAASSRPAKKKIVEQALTELKIHAVLEEELFYPAVRAHVGKDLMNEADEEHHVVKVLIAELDHMTDRNDHFDAKFTVLSENVRHHIKEEESEVLPKARELKMDFEKLGRAMLSRKEELLEKGIPVPAEDAMVAASKGRGDSPARAAHKKSPQRLSSKRSSANSTLGTLRKRKKNAS